MSVKSDSVPATKRSLNVQVARKIARSILSGELPQDAVIPGEMVLCEQFGVSRTALREAIKLLTSKGLLESRPKIGTKVLDRSYWNFLDSQLLEWMEGIVEHEEFYLQFLELRRAIEPEACALAALNATAEQRSKLSVAFQNMCDVVENATVNGFDQEAWIRVDIAFHQLIFNLTGNHFYLPFGNILSTMYKNFIVHSSQDGNFGIQEHRFIYEAIMAGDADKAREYSRNHLQASKHRLPVMS